MRKIIILLLCIPCISFAQINVEYISEKCDSMALINKQDIDVINNVFSQRNQLRDLNLANERIISALEIKNSTLDSLINKQKITINNNQILQKQYEDDYKKLQDRYNKELKKSKRKATSYQTLTGVGLIIIIILLL